MVGLVLDERIVPGGVVVAVRGEVDATNADQFETYLGGKCRPGEHVVLDLSAMTFMDSHGLLVLLRTHAFTRRHGADLHLAAVHDLPMRVLELTGIHWAMNIHPDVQQAVATVVAAHVHRLSESEPDPQSGPGWA